MATNMVASNISSDLAHLTATYYQKIGEDELMKKFHFGVPAEARDIPQHSGQTAQFFRYGVPGSNLTTAPEGAVGTGQTLSDTTWAASPGDYRDFASISDTALAVAIDDVGANMSRLMGYRGGLSVDDLTRTAIDAISGTINFVPLNSTLTRDTIGSLVATLESLDIEGLANQGGDFYIIASPLSAFDLMHDTQAGGIVDLLRSTGAATSGPMRKRESRGRVIEIAGAKVVSSSSVTTPTGQPTQRRAYAFGQGSFAIVSIAGFRPPSVTDPKRQSFNVMIRRDDGSIANPTGAIAMTAAYKFKWGFTPLDSVNYRMRTMDLETALA